MLKKYLNIIKQKKGMSLVEVMTAMTILTLMIFCFAPLFLSYFQSIDIAGQKLDEVQHESGVLQRVIGNINKSQPQSSGGYITPFQNIPLTLTSNSGVTLTETTSQNVNNQVSVDVKDLTASITTGATLKTKAADGNGGELGNIDGGLLISNPNDIESGFTTLYSNDIDAGFYCFPNSITDDFIKKDIIVIAKGMRAIISNFEVYVNVDSATVNADKNGIYKRYHNTYGGELRGDNDGNSIIEEGVSWSIDSLKDSNGVVVDDCFVITFYGGRGISFETSPVTIKYGTNTKKVEVDAPMMIMVGEANKNGEYNYYVSRGELVDPDGTGGPDTLAILQRTMKGNAPLTSAMNDVEWVDADSADDATLYTKVDGTKYGYYVMCGDEGQIRRFWRSPDLPIYGDDDEIIGYNFGNYYWGGDKTYQTDIKINRANATPSYNFNATVVPGSTSASYKFSFTSNSAADTDGNGANGYNLGTNKTAYLQSNNMWSVTAFGNDNAAQYIYATDGKLYHYQTGRHSDKEGHWTGLWSYTAYGRSVLSLSDVQKLGTGDGSYNNIPVTGKNNKGVVNREDYTWLKANNSGYYTLMGETASVNPITLTSVDAIVISDKTSKGYYKNIETSGGHYYGSEWTNIDYPSSTYNLYCGYIPAAMDLWSTRAAHDSGWKGKMTVESNNDNNPSKTAPSSSKFTRRYTDITNSNTDRYGYWRGNLGISPYYLTSGATSLANGAGQIVYYHQYDAGGAVAGVKYGWEYPGEHLVYYPYTNLGYALTGKFYDANSIASLDKTDILNKDRLASPANYSYAVWNGKQQYMTNGKVVDITVAYLSHPFAVHIAANPTDDIVYDLANNKEGSPFYYWNNRRETATYLDCASTVVPAGDKDINVSLLVGYVLGGTVEYASDVAYANTIMNNGIVMLRSGTAEIGQQSSHNSHTEEYYAKDDSGYKLIEESNVFHQFYYLNSKTPDSAEPQRSGVIGQGAYHIGNLYGADYWQNNRHIDYVSLDGGQPGTGYNYLRCHPMSNTKVTCVAWGVTWEGHPEAMWGTENGTVLSWWVDTNTTQGSHTDTSWNDRSVDAEFQSYKWIDSCNNKTFDLISYTKVVGIGNDHEWWGSVGSAAEGSGSNKGTSFSRDSERFKFFYDKTTQQLISTYNNDINKPKGNTDQEKQEFIKAAQGNKASALRISFVSTLETINDIEYADDFWIAVGDQSNKNPNEYCGTGEAWGAKPYSNEGSGSWVNVRYWVDAAQSGTHSNGNALYHWRAVKITNDTNCNIVQINNVNGMWIATGYRDGYKDGNYHAAWDNNEYDIGEKPVICWTYNPLKPYGEPGGWSDKVEFYEEGATSATTGKIDKSLIGGINSCATRS